MRPSVRISTMEAKHVLQKTFQPYLLANALAIDHHSDNQGNHTQKGRKENLFLFLRSYQKKWIFFSFWLLTGKQVCDFTKSRWHPILSINWDLFLFICALWRAHMHLIGQLFGIFSQESPNSAKVRSTAQSGRNSSGATIRTTPDELPRRGLTRHNGWGSFK